MLKEFREFAMRGSVVDMAVGIVIGGAFGGIVSSLVNDVLMPPVGLLLGGADFPDFFLVLKTGKTPGPYLSLNAATEAGAVTLNYGAFANTIISFLVIAAAMFFLVRSINRMRREEEAPSEPTTQDCQYCLSTIPIGATRCAYCTSQL